MLEILFTILSNYFDDIIFIKVIFLIFSAIFIFGLYMFIALNFNRIFIYFLIIASIILESVENLLSYLAKIFCSDESYIKYYNNYLNKRGYSGIILNNYEHIFNEFHFHSTNKVDLTSIFIFIYGELKYGPLKNNFLLLNMILI